MLSLGTDDFLAFWMASYSVGLPAGSPPPILAATSMFLISLANILPRRASMTAFLCLVVAHFEWPDMVLLPSLSRSGPGTGGGLGRRRRPRGGRTSPSTTPAGHPRSYRRRARPRPAPAPRRRPRPPRPTGP